jgi:hypothetical protein
VACSGAGRASAIRRRSRPAAVSASTSNNAPQPRRVKGGITDIWTGEQAGRAFPQKPANPGTARCRPSLLPLLLRCGVSRRRCSSSIHAVIPEALCALLLFDVALSHSQRRQLGLEAEARQSQSSTTLRVSRLPAAAAPSGSFCRLNFATDSDAPGTLAATAAARGCETRRTHYEHPQWHAVARLD